MSKPIPARHDSPLAWPQFAKCRPPHQRTTEGGSRTHTPLRTLDFESSASAIPPLRPIVFPPVFRRDRDSKSWPCKGQPLGDARSPLRVFGLAGNIEGEEPLAPAGISRLGRGLRLGRCRAVAIVLVIARRASWPFPLKRPDLLPRLACPDRIFRTTRPTGAPTFASPMWRHSSHAQVRLQ
jgi:hypothetical protein